MGENDNQQVTMEELAWLAGFTDAEGSIFVTQQYDRKDRDRPRMKGNLSLVNRGRHVLARAIDILDRLDCRPYVYEENDGKYMRVIVGSKAKIIRALEALLPLLAEKQSAALHMIKWLRDGEDQSRHLVRNRIYIQKSNPDSIGDLTSAWIAGFLDGDGTITISKTKNGNRYNFAPRVIFCNKSELNLSRIRSFLTEKNLSYSNCDNNGCTNIVIANLDGCEKVLMSILPHLNEKKPQAKILLRFIQSAGSRKDLDVEMRSENHRYSIGTPETIRTTSKDEDIVHVV